MLKVKEHTPTRLVLEQRQRAAGFATGAFTIVSAATVVMAAAEAVESLIMSGPDFLIGRIIGALLFILLGTSFVLIGTVATAQMFHGIRFEMDKQAELITLRVAQVVRPNLRSYSIYGAARLDAVADYDTRSYELFLVLRSGKRVPIATFPGADRDQMQPVLATARAFLRTVGGIQQTPA